MRQSGRTIVVLAVAAWSADPASAQELSHDFLVGPEVLFFEAGPASDLSVAARASGHLVWTPPPDDVAGFIIEPRAGLRVLTFEDRTSTEFIAELREGIFSLVRGGGVRWHLSAEQKFRTLSDQPELPAFLGPGRFEGWLTGKVTVPVVKRWELEARGDAGLVRYGPEDWEVLDRNAALGLLTLGHPLWVGVARLSGGLGVEDYRDITALAREDVRWDLRGEWVTGEPIYIQLESGLAWNRSTRAGYDYWSWRAALLLSLPVGSGSAQVYAAVASKTYRITGPPDALVAPSDRDTGSFVIVQAVQPIHRHANLHLRGELSSSETGFRNEYFQRIGFSTLVSLH
jgi:hypothetical protein